MNRRNFLSLLAVGAPASIVAGRIGAIERLRTYFFAPPGGWQNFNYKYYRVLVPVGWHVDEIGLMTHDYTGQSKFTRYGVESGLPEGYVSYFWREGKIEVISYRHEIPTLISTA
jgi:hypothetical protein